MMPEVVIVCDDCDCDRIDCVCEGIMNALHSMMLKDEDNIMIVIIVGSIIVGVVVVVVGSVFTPDSNSLLSLTLI